MATARRYLGKNYMRAVAGKFHGGALQMQPAPVALHAAAMKSVSPAG